MEGMEEEISMDAAAAPQQEAKPKWQGLSGSTLKLFAVVTMLIDHIGAAVVMRMLSARGFMEIARAGDIGMLITWLNEGDHMSMLIIYTVLRQIGRIAFPIYCFMLIEGLQRTRNVWKYAGRLGVFALISEIPFDLAFNGKMLEFGYQNVFFTLTIALMAMIALEKIAGRNWCAGAVSKDTAVKVVLSTIVTAAAAGLAHLLQTDYGARGILCILLMYFLRRTKWVELLAGYIAFVLMLGEIFAFPAFIALLFYRGRKGFSLKYFFYGFYPLHLLLLYLTCVLLGIVGYPAL